MSDAYSKYVVNLECSALDPGQLRVLSMRGREELSRLYQFELTVAPVDEVPLLIEQFQEIMDGTALMTFGDESEHPLRGVIRSIELLSTDDPRRVSYRFMLVPRMWDTQLTRGSWIYQDKTVPEIISTALTEILPEHDRFTDGEDLEMGLQGSYLPREYIVQYEESIFDFVNRQAEHWGIPYYFDHLGEKERLTFIDVQSDFPQLEGYESIAFSNAHSENSAEVVTSISAKQRMVEAQVSLREYNYRTPSIELVTALAPVDEAGRGDLHLSGEHFWTPAEGDGLASLRSQEIFSRKLRMTAESRVRGLRAGHRFTLTGGAPEFLGLARDYLIIAIEHQFGTGDGDGRYSNRLTLMPYEAVFRPARVTPRPKIYGMIHATVDSEAEDEINVPVDEWGRYKVVLPFDVAGETGGQASCWMRLATPSGGGSWGMAMQLHTGVEVAIYHVDGDPDRPVIAGALPNFENRSSITSENANQNIFSSRGGNMLTFHDG